MGGSVSVQTLTQSINNTVNNSLNQIASATGDINCNILIGSYTIGNAVNCSVEFTNNCSASASASISAVNSAVSSFYNSLSGQQQTLATQYFTLSTNVQTTNQSFNNDFNTYVTTKCTASSYVNNVIAVQNFSIGNCTSTAGNLIIKMTNTGQASANCILDVVNQIIATAANDASTKQSTGITYEFLIYGFLGIVAIIGLVVMTYIIKSIFIMSPLEKRKLALAKNPRPDILTRYATNFVDKYDNYKPNKTDNPAMLDSLMSLMK
jgi:hypothetical protein